MRPGTRNDDRPWVGMELPCIRKDREPFESATRITLGDGSKAKFWTSAWLQGHAPKDVPPQVFKLSRRKSRTVKEALENEAWIRDINLRAPPTRVAEPSVWRCFFRKPPALGSRQNCSRLPSRRLRLVCQEVTPLPTRVGALSPCSRQRLWIRCANGIHD